MGRCPTRPSVSDRTPVEVSACTKATAFTPGLALSASSNLPGSTGSLQLSLTMIGSPWQRFTFSTMRPPNTPLTHTITLSPGSTRFTKQLSMPTEPEPETGKVKSLSVWNA